MVMIIPPFSKHLQQQSHHSNSKRDVSSSNTVGLVVSHILVQTPYWRHRLKSELHKDHGHLPQVSGGHRFAEGARGPGDLGLAPTGAKRRPNPRVRVIRLAAYKKQEPCAPAFRMHRAREDSNPRPSGP